MLAQRILLALTLIFACGSQAAGIPKAKESFSADFTMTVETPRGNQTVGGKLYSDKDKERREIQSSPGLSSVTILRMDEGVVWTLLPGNKYFEHPLPKDAKDASGGWAGSEDIELEAVEKEEVNGIKTTKHKILVNSGDAQREGFIWLSAEDIPVKIQGKEIRPEGEFRFINELQNVKIGSQAASLFELPEDAESATPQMPGIPPKAAEPAKQP